jgi:hypothetical protein
MLTRLVIGLLAVGTLDPNVFPNGTNGNNINAAPEVPTNFKKSRRDIIDLLAFPLIIRFLNIKTYEKQAKVLI